MSQFSQEYGVHDVRVAQELLADGTGMNKDVFYSFLDVAFDPIEKHAEKDFNLTLNQLLTQVTPYWERKKPLTNKVFTELCATLFLIIGYKIKDEFKGLESTFAQILMMIMIAPPLTAEQIALNVMSMGCAPPQMVMKRGGGRRRKTRRRRGGGNVFGSKSKKKKKEPALASLHQLHREHGAARRGAPRLVLERDDKPVVLAQIPAGLLPGQKFKVNVLGQLLTVAVPPGMAYPQQIHVEMPAAAGVVRRGRSTTAARHQKIHAEHLTPEQLKDLHDLGAQPKIKQLVTEVLGDTDADTCAPGTLRRRLLDRLPEFKLTEVQAEVAMDELEKTIATQRPLISNTVWEELNAAINTHGFGDSTDDDMFKAQPGTTYYFTDEQKRRLEKKVAYSMKEAKIGSCLSLIWFTGEWMVFEAGTFGKFKFELANMIQPTLVKCKMCAPLFKSAGSVGFSTAGGFSVTASSVTPTACTAKIAACCAPVSYALSKMSLCQWVSTCLTNAGVTTALPIIAGLCCCVMSVRLANAQRQVTGSHFDVAGNFWEEVTEEDADNAGIAIGLGPVAEGGRGRKHEIVSGSGPNAAKPSGDRGGVLDRRNPSGHGAPYRGVPDQRKYRWKCKGDDLNNVSLVTAQLKNARALTVGIAKRVINVLTGGAQRERDLVATLGTAAGIGYGLGGAAGFSALHAGLMQMMRAPVHIPAQLHQQPPANAVAWGTHIRPKVATSGAGLRQRTHPRRFPGRFAAPPPPPAGAAAAASTGATGAFSMGATAPVGGAFSMGATAPAGGAFSMGATAPAGGAFSMGATASAGGGATTGAKNEWRSLGISKVTGVETFKNLSTGQRVYKKDLPAGAVVPPRKGGRRTRRRRAKKSKRKSRRRKKKNKIRAARRRRTRRTRRRR